VLFFIDETWQVIGGQAVAALGAVAIPRSSYNAFCREVWQIKQNVLGAKRLDDCEIKGKDCFARSAFRKQEGGHSKLLQCAEETLTAVRKYSGRAFAVWTTNEDSLMLRNTDPTEISEIYRQLLIDFRWCMRGAKGTGRQGLLFFDHRGKPEDLSAACAVQNYVARVKGDWRARFVQTPHFTPSAVSPGIQAADLIAYLAGHRHDPSMRPELGPYWEIVERIAFRRQERPNHVALRAVQSPLAAVGT